MTVSGKPRVEFTGYRFGRDWKDLPQSSGVVFESIESDKGSTVNRV